MTHLYVNDYTMYSSCGLISTVPGKQQTILAAYIIEAAKAPAERRTCPELCLNMADLVDGFSEISSGNFEDFIYSTELPFSNYIQFYIYKQKIVMFQKPDERGNKYGLSI